MKMGARVHFHTAGRLLAESADARLDRYFLPVQLACDPARNNLDPICYCEDKSISPGRAGGFRNWAARDLMDFLNQRVRDLT